MTSRITAELYDTKSYYKLIVSITKCEKLSKSNECNSEENLEGEGKEGLCNI